MDKNIITIEDMKLIVKNITEIMETEKDYLCNLDSKLGDGDIGLSMSKGFQAVNQYLKEFSKNDMGELFIKSGFIIADKAPSTIGVLVGSSFMQGGKTVKGKRSEEHTSELQSRFDLVCRLLLEKKNNNY